MRPTRRGVWVVAGAAPLALLTTIMPALWPYWLSLTILGLASLGVDGILAPRLGDVRVVVRLPSKLHVGVEGEGLLHLALDRGRPAVFGVHIDVSDGVSVKTPPRTPPVSVDGVDVPFSLLAKRRGRAEVSAVWLRSVGPMGLFELQRHVSTSIDREVEPDLPGAAREAQRALALRSASAGVHVERYRGDGTEFESLRKYVPGFDIRSIDWKASARLATLLVRETRAERNRDVVIAVDSGRLMGELIDGIPRSDHAVRAGLALAVVAARVGDRVGFTSFDDRLRGYLPPMAGPGAVGRIGRTASYVSYSTAETNYTVGLMELSARQRRRALIVVMTDFVDSVTAELMIENVSRLARRHLVLFVALRDPLLERLAGAAPDGLQSLHRSVVASDLLHDRDVVLRRLGRVGVTCLDATPKEVSAGLIDRYLLAKRKELF